LHTIKDLYDLRDELRDIGYCNLTTDKVNDKLNNNTTRDIYLIEEYEETEQTMPYLKFVILKINDELLLILIGKYSTYISSLVV